MGAGRHHGRVPGGRGAQLLPAGAASRVPYFRSRQGARPEGVPVGLHIARGGLFRVPFVPPPADQGRDDDPALPRGVAYLRARQGYRVVRTLGGIPGRQRRCAGRQRVLFAAQPGIRLGVQPDDHRHVRGDRRLCAPGTGRLPAGRGGDRAVPAGVGLLQAPEYSVRRFAGHPQDRRGARDHEARGRGRPHAAGDRRTPVGQLFVVPQDVPAVCRYLACAISLADPVPACQRAARYDGAHRRGDRIQAPVRDPEPLFNFPKGRASRPSSTAASGGSPGGNPLSRRPSPGFRAARRICGSLRRHVPHRWRSGAKAPPCSSGR